MFIIKGWVSSESTSLIINSSPLCTGISFIHIRCSRSPFGSETPAPREHVAPASDTHSVNAALPPPAIHSCPLYFINIFMDLPQRTLVGWPDAVGMLTLAIALGTRLARTKLLIWVTPLCI